MSEELVSLKAKAYDFIAVIEGLQGQIRDYQNQLRQVNDSITKLTQVIKE